MSQRKKSFSGQISDADIRLLRIYKKVVECGGFSAAEVELQISRSAISMAMNDLETRIGLRLCQRGRSGFSLTEEGAEVYEATLRLLVATEGFKTRVNSLHAWLKGELNIGITDNLVTAPEMYITNALSALKARGPDVQINIRMIPPNDVELGVIDGRLQIGVVPTLKLRPGLNYLSLYNENSQLYCASDHTLFEAETVDDNQLSAFDAVLPAYAQTPEIKAEHGSLKPAATATDREGIAFLILTGRYIGYLPTHYAKRWVRDGLMKAIEPEKYQYETQYSAITRKGASPNLVLETYLEELEKLVVAEK